MDGNIVGIGGCTSIEYHCRAIIHHNGGLQNGHYVCQGLKDDGTVIVYNDSSVSKFNLEKGDSQTSDTAYIILYERKSTPDSRQNSDFSAFVQPFSSPTSRIIISSPRTPLRTLQVTDSANNSEETRTGMSSPMLGSRKHHHQEAEQRTPQKKERERGGVKNPGSPYSPPHKQERRGRTQRNLAPLPRPEHAQSAQRGTSPPDVINGKSRLATSRSSIGLLTVSSISPSRGQMTQKSTLRTHKTKIAARSHSVLTERFDNSPTPTNSPIAGNLYQQSPSPRRIGFDCQTFQMQEVSPDLLTTSESISSPRTPLRQLQDVEPSLSQSHLSACLPASFQSQNPSTPSESTQSTCPAGTPLIHIQQPKPTKSSQTAPLKAKRVLYQRLDNKILISLNKKKDKELKRLRKLNKKRRQSKLHLQESSLEYLKNSLPPRAVEFIKRQIKLHKAKPQGRRYEQEDLILSLGLRKGGRKAEAAFKDMFIIPSKKTMFRFVQGLNLQAGLQEFILDGVEAFVETLEDSRDAFAVLIWDELKIDEFLAWSNKWKRFIGFEDFGSEKLPSRAGKETSHVVCDHALIFYVVLLRNRKVKFPVAYYFCKDMTPSHILADLIEVNVQRVRAKGIKLVFGTCDQAPCNLKALKILNTSVEKPYFLQNGLEFFCAPDAVHILKCLVSLFRRYDVELRPGQFAKIAHIEELLRVKKKLVGTTLAPKLTEKHVYARDKLAMKCALAFQLVSSSVSAALNTLLAKGLLPSDAKYTIEFVEFMDNLIDSFNGSEFSDVKVLKARLHKNSAHWEFWQKAEQYMSGWRFVKKDGSTVYTPSIESTIRLIKTLQNFYPFLERHGFDYLLTRRIQQDPVEHFNGEMREQVGGGRDPTAMNFATCFVSAFLSQLMINSVPNKNRNCENDGLSCTPLASFIFDSMYKQSQRTRCSLPSGDDSEEDEEQLIGDGEVEFDLDSLQEQCDSYYAGVCLRKINTKLNCKPCIETATSEEMLPSQIYVSFKEYSNTEDRLFYASDDFSTSVCSMLRGTLCLLKKSAHKSNIFQTVKEGIFNSTIPFSFGCEEHREMFANILNSYIIKCSVYWYAKKVNRKEIKI
ncbi:uncharacterized protein LOC132198916 [Neocloeon triangulifer]|uniref:uncharacterized protein LOC132198916 n=1 Tax=Neocloeon triangulifer TaxID=2078957 RepID=UPI00286F8072|nr:uncharacterized protein LOC132198916 [Neocloeon triangulifer]